MESKTVSYVIRLASEVDQPQTIAGNRTTIRCIGGDRRERCPVRSDFAENRRATVLAGVLGPSSTITAPPWRLIRDFL